MQNNPVIEYRYNPKLKLIIDKSKLKHIFVMFKALPDNDMIKNIDFIKYLKPQEIQDLQNKKTHLVIDYTDEGFSGIRHKIYDYIYQYIELNAIDPSQIVLLTSNLKESINMSYYAVRHKKKPLHALGFSNFEVITKSMIPNQLPFDEQYIRCRNMLASQDIKLFASLSRANRGHRAYAAFRLSTSKYKDMGLISHAELEREFFIKKLKKNKKQYLKFEKWKNTLPLVVDRTDFDDTTSWQMVDSSELIFNSTLFHIVGESLADDYYSTSIFYTEKTLKPIHYLQPFVVYGQRGIHSYLKKAGYELFEEEFDYSFDEEIDEIERFDKMFAMLKPVMNKLNQMSIEEKINWRFKHIEKLRHNYEVLYNYTYRKTELLSFLKKIARGNNVHG